MMAYPTRKHEMVMLVDSNDQMTGTMEKFAVHRAGMLHRAISVFIFNSKGHMLLQQRSIKKYHSGGKWSNTCCSHPTPGETTIDAARRRLKEEMGIDSELKSVFQFIYLAQLNNGLIEHEYDHVFFGTTDTIPKPDPVEVAAYEYATIEEIAERLKTHPGQFSEWFKICFGQVLNHHHYNQVQ